MSFSNPRTASRQLLQIRFLDLGPANLKQKRIPKHVPIQG
jgi:hypothetical protein